MAYKIFATGNWVNAENELFEDLINITPKKDGKWKNIIVIDNVEKADFIIAIQELPTRYLDKIRKVLLFQHEPPWIKQFKPLEEAHNFTYDNFMHLLMWWSDINFPAEYPAKVKKISTIFSNKKLSKGHVKRLTFLERYIQQYKDIDIYGWNMSLPEFKQLYKGAPAKHKKHIALLPYKYSLVMENGVYKNYFTDRVADSFLCWTMPIYWGCPNLNDFFPESSFYAINIDSNDAIDELHYISNLQITEKQISAIAEARKLILYEYNALEQIRKIIERI